MDKGKAVEAELVEPVVHDPDALYVEHGQDVEVVRVEAGARLPPLG